MKLDIFTDGACSGNPGPAGVGVLISSEGKVVKEISKYIGEGTNNIAEYSALICALIEAQALKADEVNIKSDSELMVKQVNGLYKVKHENIIPLFEQVKQLSNGFKVFKLTHIPRELNAVADRLSTQAIKK